MLKSISEEKAQKKEASASLLFNLFFCFEILNVFFNDSHFLIIPQNPFGNNPFQTPIHSFN
ncbi:hypothetical protein CLW00_102101 [Mongoliibacter ruber]|uniref:Uncharacterized protein n=1 Tax=Mongoliibacter ruber TaxID=1750599 RepID=A0A2T0WSH8_9BACT|nr:hypothetical protein CLW00_102101 [Mongoliibacter ruber]